METLNIPIYFKLSSIIEEITKTEDFQIFVIAALASLFFVVCSTLFIRHKILASGATNSVEHNRKNLPKNFSAKIIVIFIAIVAFFAVAWLSISNYAFAEDDSPLVPSGDLVGEVSPDGSSIDFQEIQLTNVSDASYSITSSLISVSDEAKSFESTLLLSSLTIKSSHENDMEKTTIFQGNPNGQAFELQDLYSIESQESVSLSLYIQNCNAETAKALSGLKVFELSVTTKEEYREDPQITVPASTQNVDAKDYITLGSDEVSKVSTAEWNSPTSSNEGVATAEWVSGGLRVNGVSSGTAQITVSVDVSPDKVYAAGSKTFTVEVNRIDPQIEVPASTQNVDAKDYITLGSDEVSKVSTAEWNTPTSSNAGVATVTWTSGAFVVNGVSSGTATITVSVGESDDGVYSADSKTFSVNVNKIDPQIVVPSTEQEVDALDNITLDSGVVSKQSTEGWNTPTSSNAGVATVAWTSGAFVVNGVSSGTAQITVSVNESADGVYLAGFKTFFVKVNRIDPQIVVPDSEQEVNALSELSLSSDQITKESSAKWEAAESSDADIATATWDNTTTLKVIANKGGTVTITVSVNESDDGVYDAGSNSFIVNVRKLNPRIELPIFTEELEAQKTTTLYAGNFKKQSPVEWNALESDDENVAIAEWLFPRDGIKLTSARAGLAKITVSVDESEDDIWDAGQESFYIKVNRKEAEITAPDSLITVPILDSTILDDSVLSKSSPVEWNKPEIEDSSVASASWTADGLTINAHSTGYTEMTVSVDESVDGAWAGSSHTFMVRVDRLDPEVWVSGEIQNVRINSCVSLDENNFSKQSTAGWNDPNIQDIEGEGVVDVEWDDEKLKITGKSLGRSFISLSVDESDDGIYDRSWGTYGFEVVVTQFSDPGITVPLESQSVAIGSPLFLDDTYISKKSTADWKDPELSNPEVVNAEWTPDGLKLSGKKAGTSKITVSVDAEDPFKEGSRSFIVNVFPENPVLTYSVVSNPEDSEYGFDVNTDPESPCPDLDFMSTNKEKGWTTAETQIKVHAYQDCIFTLCGLSDGENERSFGTFSELNSREKALNFYDKTGQRLSHAYDLKANENDYTIYVSYIKNTGLVRNTDRFYFSASSVLEANIKVPRNLKEVPLGSSLTLKNIEVSKQSTAEWNTPTSSAENVATAEWVNGELVITGKSKGKAEITVSVDPSEDGQWLGGSKTFSVEIKPQVDPNISILSDTQYLTMGKEHVIDLSCIHKSTTADWNLPISSNSNIATAEWTSGGLKIVGKKVGTSKITLSVNASEDGVFLPGSKSFIVSVMPEMPKYTFDVVCNSKEFEYGFEANTDSNSPCPELNYMSSNKGVHNSTSEARIKIHANEDCTVTLIGYSDGDYNDYGVFSKPNSKEEAFSFYHKFGQKYLYTYDLKASDEDYTIYISYSKNYMASSCTDRLYFSILPGLDPNIIVPKNVKEVATGNTLVLGTDEVWKQSPGDWTTPKSSDDNIVTAKWTDDGLALTGEREGSAEITVFIDSSNDGVWAADFKTFSVEVKNTSVDPCIVVPTNSLSLTMESDLILDSSQVSKISPAEWNAPELSDGSIATAQWTAEGLKITGLNVGTTKVTVSVNDSGAYRQGSNTFVVTVFSRFTKYNYTIIGFPEKGKYGFDRNVDPDSPCPDLDFMSTNQFKNNTTAEAQIKIHVYQDCSFTLYGYSNSNPDDYGTFSKPNSKEVAFSFYNQSAKRLSYTYDLKASDEDYTIYITYTKDDNLTSKTDRFYFSASTPPASDPLIVVPNSTKEVPLWKPLTLNDNEVSKQSPAEWKDPVSSDQNIATAMWTDYGLKIIGINDGQAEITVSVDASKDGVWCAGSETFTVEVKSQIDPNIVVPIDSQSLTVGSDLILDSSRIYKSSTAEWDKPESSDENVATATWTDNGLKIFGNNVGTCKIKVSVQESEHYTEGSKTFIVAVFPRNSKYTYTVISNPEYAEYGFEPNLDPDSPCSDLDFMSSNVWEGGTVAETQIKVHAYKDCDFTLYGYSDGEDEHDYGTFSKPNSREEAFTFCNLSCQELSYTYNLKASAEDYTIYVSYIKDSYSSYNTDRFYFSALPALDPDIIVPKSVIEVPYGGILTLRSDEISKQSTAEWKDPEFSDKSVAIANWTDYGLMISGLSFGNTEITVSVDASSDGVYCAGSKTFKLEVKTDVDPHIVVPAESQSLTVDSDLVLDSNHIYKNSPAEWNIPESSNENVATATWTDNVLKISADQEGTCKIKVSVGAWGSYKGGSATFIVAVFPDNPKYTYIVVGNSEDTEYGFEANTDPESPCPELDFMSTNKGVNDSIAEAQIKVHAKTDCKFTLNGYSDGENSYDYGMFSKLNSKETALNFQGKQGMLLSYTYNLKANEDYVIYVSYKKDSGGDRYTDRFYFGVSSLLNPNIIVPENDIGVPLENSITLGIDDVSKQSTVDWNDPHSDDESVATAEWTDEGLKITGLKEGSTYITVSVNASTDGIWDAGSRTFSISVEAQVEPNIIVPLDSQSITAGEDIVLDSSLIRKSSTVEWNDPELSNPDVLTAEWTTDGLKISGIQVGTCKIKVSVNESSIYYEGFATFIVAVFPNNPKYTYTVISNPEGAEYGFETNLDPDSPCPDLDFMSSNVWEEETVAEAQIKVHAYDDCQFTICGYSDGYEGYDYGTFSKPNSREEAFSFYFFNERKHSYTYELKASEEDYTIYVSYINDDEYDENTDRFYFSALPALDPKIVVPQHVKELPEGGSLTLGKTEVNKQSYGRWTKAISSDENIAKAKWIDDELVITGVSLGTCAITVFVGASADGVYAPGSKTVNVEVKTLAEPNIVVPKDFQSLTVGTELILDDTIINKNSGAEWNEPEVSDENVVSAKWEDSGLKIFGKQAGTSKITLSVDAEDPFIKGSNTFLVTVFSQKAKYTYTVIGNSTETEYGFEVNNDRNSPCPDLDYMSSNNGIDSSFAEAQIKVHAYEDCCFTLYGYSDGEDAYDYGIFSKPNSREEALTFYKNSCQELSYTYNLKASAEEYIIYVYYIKDSTSYDHTDRFYFSAAASNNPGIVVPESVKEISSGGSLTLGSDCVSKQSTAEWNKPTSSDENVATAIWSNEGLKITAVGNGVSYISVSVNISEDGVWASGSSTFKIKIKNMIDPNIEVPIESQCVVSGSSIIVDKDAIRKSSSSDWNDPLSNNSKIATAEWTSDGLKIFGKKIGKCEISLSVNADEKHNEGCKTLLVIVLPKGTPYTYNYIGKPLGADYGFALNSDPDSPCPQLDFMSTNKGVNDSIAEAQIKVHAKTDCKFTLNGYSDGENSYDYGMFSKLNSKESALNFQGKQGKLLSYTYNLKANEDYVIYVSYKKDSSGGSYTDRFYFGVGDKPDDSASISNVVEQGLLHKIYARPELYALAFNEVKTIIDKNKKELWRYLMI